MSPLVSTTFFFKDYPLKRINFETLPICRLLYPLNSD